MGGDGGSVGATSCGLKYCHSDTALSGGGQQEVPALYFNQFIARGEELQLLTGSGNKSKT